MTYRPKLFVGIELDNRIRKHCADVGARLQANGFDGRFEPPEKLHITIAFLGWVDPEQVQAIRDALHTIARAAAPFTLTLDTIGAFPHERRPKIVWIGSSDQGKAFRTLTHVAREIYAAAGFAFGKDAIAHVTLARVKGGHAHLPMLDVKPAHLHVTRVTLFESLPAGKTTRYEVLDRAPLNPQA